MASKKRSCPCKKLPMCLSSFTAAEYGDLHTLSKSGAIDRQDTAGYTPLHYASQNGHIAATAYLLRSGAKVDGANTCGATPLHRASFSGAVGTIRLLIDSKANLLSRDKSFGDEMTPLHKATAGGRYLAVQLLVDALKSQGQLYEALSSQDSTGRTPLELSKEMKENQEEEQASVKRWDGVAGGPADWEKVSQILDTADSHSVKSPTKLAPIPTHLSEANSCLDCGVGENGQCLSASWEKAFRSVLMSQVCLPIPQHNLDNGVDTRSKENQARKDGAKLQVQARITTEIENETAKSRTASKKKSQSMGKSCALCDELSIALFRSAQGSLVCRSCSRAAKRQY